MWEFNQIYRNLEGLLTDAEQFAELLLEPLSVVDAAEIQPFAPGDFAVEPHCELPLLGGAVLFEDFSLRIQADSRAASSDGPVVGRRRSPDCCCVSWTSSEARFSWAASRSNACRGGLYALLWAHQSGGFLPTAEVERITALA
jgi:hypothetical protein